MEKQQEIIHKFGEIMTKYSPELSTKEYSKEEMKSISDSIKASLEEQIAAAKKEQE